jgi:hypothetical protein
VIGKFPEVLEGTVGEDWKIGMRARIGDEGRRSKGKHELISEFFLEDLHCAPQITDRDPAITRPLPGPTRQSLLRKTEMACPNVPEGRCQGMGSKRD